MNKVQKKHNDLLYFFKLCCFFTTSTIMFNIQKFSEIREILEKHNKTGKIVAISKNHPQESVVESIKQGVHIFGENRVQEAKNKFVNIKKDNPKIE